LSIHYVLVFPVVSFLLAFQPISYMHSSFSFGYNSKKNIPDTRWYGHFFLFCYMEFVPKDFPHLSVTLCICRHYAAYKSKDGEENKWIRFFRSPYLKGHI
jgi:hypothetical protein